MRYFNHLDRLQTEPMLQNDQIEQLKKELMRIKELYESLDKENPLEFSLSVRENYKDDSVMQKRKKIQLMKEIQVIRQGQEDMDENFLDEIFGIGETTEICGLAATGKTQICFQLCLNVQLPKELGGVDGEALYVDTHGDFALERMTEMAKSLRQQVLKKIDKEPALIKKYKEEFSIDRILQKVKFVRILDDNQQSLFHNQLEDRLSNSPLSKVKIIIFDTLSEHFKLSDISYQERKRIISQALMGLLELAQKFQISVVLINNMKLQKKDFQSEIGGGIGGGISGMGMGNAGSGLIYQQSKPEPMFGEDLFQCVTNRILLEKDHQISEDNVFKAKLIKGSIANKQSTNTCHFLITERGISSIL
ncbi:dna repair protein rad51 homolog 3 [Stylonychia lemnae]|uniref:DNA repair protein RAD51 homolog 3 n=1 Tax=Stylonychia lemnae TaxID=5949 RepID=A0A077ZZD0_STYLE|nr:dna repair protein rad51 homolog 3 [Stylonychia lemnae]|eukprot:CDW73853.1 dna repair protein rad51 homolog 3 [Stylonychia lemnae]